MEWLYTLPTIAPLRTGIPPLAKAGLIASDRLLYTSPHAVLEAEAPGSSLASFEWLQPEDSTPLDARSVLSAVVFDTLINNRDR